jgi:hypothetical protein
MVDSKNLKWVGSARQGRNLRNVGLAMHQAEPEPVMDVDDDAEQTAADRPAEKSTG